MFTFHWMRLLKIGEVCKCLFFQPIPKGRVHYGGVSCYSCRAFFRWDNFFLWMYICAFVYLCICVFVYLYTCISICIWSISVWRRLLHSTGETTKRFFFGGKCLKMCKCKSLCLAGFGICKKSAAAIGRSWTLVPDCVMQQLIWSQRCTFPFLELQSPKPEASLL